MEKSRFLLQIFLIVVFLVGLYVYSTYDMKRSIIKMENMENQNDTTKSECPNLLIKRGNILLLLNTIQPEVEGVNPLPFYNLDEYINYLEIQRNKGNDCPVLFLQQENDAQGNDVYRVRPSPFDQAGGLSEQPAAQQYDNSKRMPVKALDANQEYPPFNQGNYPGFDPQNLYVGIYTNIDQVHDSTRTESNISDNPMDPNWGGVIFTQQKVDSGKYDENNITIPHYTTPKTTSFIPGLYGEPIPPNEFDATKGVKQDPVKHANK